MFRELRRKLGVTKGAQAHGDRPAQGQRELASDSQRGIMVDGHWEW